MTFENFTKVLCKHKSLEILEDFLMTFENF